MSINKINRSTQAESNFNFSNATSFEVFESNDTSSTTSTTLQTKLSATTITSIEGKYIIQWFAEIANSTNNNTNLFTVEWKATSSGTWITLTDTDTFIGRSEVYQAVTGFRVVDHTTTDTIDIRVRWARGTGGTARIRNVNVYIFRVELT